MDKSLDELIKENPRKFSLKNGKPQRRHDITGKNAGPKKGPGTKKNNTPLMAVSKNSGRVTKKTGKLAVKNGPKGGRPINNSNSPIKAGPGKTVVDARNKLLAKNRQKITDARDKLAAITKASKTDLRQKLTAKRPGSAIKPMNIKRTVANNIHKIVKEIGSNSSASRTIIGRTVQNELARLPGRTINNQYAPQVYSVPPPAQYYAYQADSSYTRSSAAMDAEPQLPASKRIRSTDKRLGPREDTRVKLEQGYKVFVSNLHHKVTQDDISELFGDVGPLMRATLQRPGIAEVVYIRRDDALRAVDVYHNRQLDGLPMHCTFENTYDVRRETVPPSNKPRANSSGKGPVAPDINTIHKALFNKASGSSQIFTVTLPKKDS